MENVCETTTNSLVDLSMDSTNHHSESTEGSNTDTPLITHPGALSCITSPVYKANYSPSTTCVPIKNMKRSFDVAFLMAPDENLLKKQQKYDELRVITTDMMTKTLSAQSPDPEGKAAESDSEATLRYDDNSVLENINESVIKTGSFLEKIELLPKHNKQLITGLHQNRGGFFENSCFFVPKNDGSPHEDTSDDESAVPCKKQEYNANRINVQTTDCGNCINDKYGKLYSSGKHKLQNICSAGCSSTEISLSAFTKVPTVASKSDLNRPLSTPMPVSPLSVSPLSAGGLSPDNVIYQDSVKSGPDNSPLLQHFTQTATKSFQNPVHFLLHNPHLTQFSIPPVGKPVTSAYSSAAFLPQEENCNKMSRDVLEGGMTNGKFKSDYGSYLMKTSLSSNKPFHQSSAADVEINHNFTSNTNGSVKIRQNNIMCPYGENFSGHPRLSSAVYPFPAVPFTNSNPTDLIKRSPPPNILASVTNPVAASTIVSSPLLPSAFAALSLPIQNICAKCNITFRMTSDLVYHMRSHHKNDNWSNDPFRRRREQDKLKCPVCSESFRERHHLTRHMTAHQDKEGDIIDESPFREKMCSFESDTIGRRKNISTTIMIPQHGGSEK